MELPEVARDEAWDEARFKEQKFGLLDRAHEAGDDLVHGNLIQQRHYRIASAAYCAGYVRFYYLGLTSRTEEKYAGGRTGKGHDDTVLACGLALWAVRQAQPGALGLRGALCPDSDAIDLGLNRTVSAGPIHGKGLSEDQYGEYELPQDSQPLRSGLDDQLVASCPLGGAWGGYGLDL